MHGTPSSRAEVGDYEPGLLEERGVCAVAVNRPGYGATDPLGDLDLLARTKDAVAVAERLGMRRFAVQGTSGGGPYALACAVLMPDQVLAVILTSAGGCISEEGAGTACQRTSPRAGGRNGATRRGARDRLEAAMAELRADPLGGLRSLTSTWPADERGWIEERTAQAVAEDTVEAARQGGTAGGSTVRRRASRWPFDVADIRERPHLPR